MPRQWRISEPKITLLANQVYLMPEEERSLSGAKRHLDKHHYITTTSDISDHVSAITWPDRRNRLSSVIKV